MDICKTSRRVLFRLERDKIITERGNDIGIFLQPSFPTTLNLSKTLSVCGASPISGVRS